MKNINLKLNFLWDDCIDSDTFTVTVSNNVNKNDIIKALKDGHRYLCEEDETDTYGTCGRTPGTLLDYVCEKNGWTWNNFKFDIELDFD